MTHKKQEQRVAQTQTLNNEPRRLDALGLTIIVANYNNARYLDRAVESLRNQNDPDFKVIICDDASTDDSRECLERLKADGRLDARFTIIINPLNKGYPGTLNRMLEVSGTVWNAILDSDDAFLPNATWEIKQEIARLNRGGQQERASMIYTNFYYCDDQLRIQTLGYSRFIPDGMTNLEANCVSATRVVNKLFVDRLGGFDTSFECAEDKDIIYRLEEVGSLHFINHPLYLYRRNPGSITHTKNALKWAEIAREKALKRRKNANQAKKDSK